MVTLIDFVIELVTSIVRLVLTFIFDVFLGVGPISALSFLFGAAFVTAASLALGYFVLGAALNSVSGFGASAPDASRRRRA
ncbi:hypothetical protein GL213_02660 [Halogeometricum borinquense]|uniref:Uncharacterized protein n=2 Tax=Halogeometricum borinquense TaxID=60847 RepID=E4NM36_HALBP|nr:hypothetical protein [Halogeometricum borinquense]ADQ66135.1 hypothetical protein Hbor_05340 [Halogeometricum borinquense DSM 11551]ELY27370.1 hypothetical protein C499_09914 [Halogeometricum borinquense DSM 11551]QIB75890.1 hypothetical protein G3I44_17350 [Halogeometricum borinquense]QIQ75527.1 hypothetical protein GL213_02660 [Halogeometricum borinquense]RYJ14824.1 hypothetical protein ELS19_13245 [Halogeometricum borinquense]